MGFFGITLLRPEWHIIGSFVLKFSPSGFGILLIRSNHRKRNALWERFSRRDENNGDVAVTRYLDLHGAQRRGCGICLLMICSSSCYLHGPGTGITNL